MLCAFAFKRGGVLLLAQNLPLSEQEMWMESYNEEKEQQNEVINSLFALTFQTGPCKS